LIFKNVVKKPINSKELVKVIEEVNMSLDNDLQYRKEGKQHRKSTFSKLGIFWS